MIGIACLLLVAATLAQRPDAGVPVVEPSALLRDPNLIGREVTVDDRLRYFQAHKRAEGQVFDEILLKRTEVVFRLPVGLRPERAPRQPAVRVTGILQQDGRQVYCEVSSYEMMPADLDRLDKEIKRLAPGDSAGRATWAAWAERRGRDFKDVDLLARARGLEAEALLIDADRPGADDLALSRRARSRGLDDLAGALAHRGLRAKLFAAKSPDDLARLAGEVQAALPDSAEPHQAEGSANWKARVLQNPIASYRAASPEVQAALDRDLLGDVLQRRFERRVAASPADAAALSEEAKAKLPDRPGVAARLRDRGLEVSEKGVAEMRLSEVEDLAQSFRDGGQPDRARALLKTWLEERRRRVNPGDADGLVGLAAQYERVLGDRSTAVDLLREAAKADPQSKAAADVFRRMGYRKSAEGTWFDPAAAAGPKPTATAEAAPPAASPTRSSSGSLRGMTPEQVRRELGGKPDRIARSATQDATLEQWIYKQGARGTRVVNIRRPRGNGRPEVVADYTLP